MLAFRPMNIRLRVVEMAAIKALVKPTLLRWARDRAKVKPEDAAKAAHVIRA
jgi:hypothetical protein